MFTLMEPMEILSLKESPAITSEEDTWTGIIEEGIFSCYNERQD